jgi:glycosyltransferase involved in cell wall biosynthesis
MKIIQVCSNYYPDIGGIETHVKEISEALVRRGNDVEVVCTYSSHELPKKDIINGVKVTRLWALAPDGAYYFSPMIYFYLITKEYDVIHAHNYHSFPALFAALAAKKNFVFTAHTFGSNTSFLKNLMHIFYKPFAKYFIINKSKIIISVTKKEMEILRTKFRLSSNRIVYIPLPINIKSTVKRSKGNSSIVKIGSLGRLSEEKNIEFLIFAFKLVKGKFRNCELYIAGDGPLKSKLQEMSKQEKDIHFLGGLNHENALHFLSTLDLFVLPSKFEVSSISSFEAMASGVPVIMTPVGELPLLFEHGKHCLFAKNDDINDIAEKIGTLIENRTLAMELAKNGEMEVRKRDINEIIEQYIVCYNKLIENS